MGEKLVKGRKRHIVVDSDGRLLNVWVLPADVGDREAARVLLEEVCERFPRLRHIWADGGYTGDLKDALAALSGVTVEVVSKLAGQQGFVVIPRRWVVERTFGWLGRHRRLSKDDETLTDSAETWIWLASIRLLLTRLAAAAG